MVELVVVSKKATRHFAINIGLYDDLSEERSAAHQLKYIILKMKSQSNREDSDFKDAENVDENINFRLVAYSAPHTEFARLSRQNCHAGVFYVRSGY